MNNPRPAFLAMLLVGATVFGLAAPASAAKGDCGQPASSGAAPGVSDVLCCLRQAVGQQCAPRPCVCDLNRDGKVSVSDVLTHLRYVIGPRIPEATLTCNCEFGLPCTSARLHASPGSTLDLGWTGISHDSDLGSGSFVDVRVLKRCSDSGAACTRHSDCVNHNCVATCDCGFDTSCEFTGPSSQKRCVTTLEACDTNADCPSGTGCADPAGPPLPLSSGGTPICVQNFYDAPLSGTADTATGEALASTALKSRIHLGLTVDKPCPRCGGPDENPKPGQQFTCSGGQKHGEACTVDAVSPLFGGTSYDCPPTLNSNVMGAGASLRLREITTGTATKTAKLPCANLAFRSNPLNAPANPGKCLDNNAACSSNADCRRCTGDAAVACADDSDCSGNGTCAEAPAQPVSCGFWCHCGFCNNDPAQPCFDSSECAAGQTCQAGTGTGTQQNAPQQRPNDCSVDKFLCGQDAPERCAATNSGHCELQPWRACASSSDCPAGSAGDCILEPRPCFESRLTRSGDPAPLGSYCQAGPADLCAGDGDCRRCAAAPETACSTNADCDGSGPCGPSPCVGDAVRPETVALACMPATSSSAINNVQGIHGPVAVHGRTFVEVCRCGDSAIGCGEGCDDGNAVPGDGCDENCDVE